MNIHPIFVHFPIAFLTIYSICEIFTTKKLKSNETWLMIKIFLLVVGFLGTLAAVSTGDMASESMESGSIGSLVSTHAFFAIFTEWVYGILSISYVLKFLSEKNKLPFMENGLVKFILSIAKRFVYFALPISIIGLVAVTITGSLGGAIVYGPDADPVVSFIYKILIGQ